MLTYPLGENKTHLYESLYEYIKNDILSGKLRSGEKLPSKRSLAGHLKVSVITVETAYAQLIAEGYLYAVEKSGYYVSPVEELPRIPPKKEMPPAEQLPEKEYFMDFKTGHISREHFPYAVLSRLMRAVISEKEDILTPLAYNGTEALRDAIAKYLYRFRGINVESDQIVIGAGTEYLYTLMIQLLGREKIYAVEDPGYHKIPKIYRLNGVKLRYVGMDAFGLSASELKKEPTDVLHISPTHHYPTGIVMPIGRRLELLKWASESDGRYIIEDDYDSEFRFSGKPIPPLFSIDENEKVIYMNTFSRSIAPAIRISFMILPRTLAEVYRRSMSFYSCTVSAFDQYMLAKFIDEGYFERHINRMKTLYREKRDAVIRAIRGSAFAQKAQILEENAGLHFLLRFETSLSDEAFAKKAAQVGLLLSFLSEYTEKPRDADMHTLIINYAGIDMEKLPEALHRLETIIA